MEVKKTTATSSELSSDIDLGLDRVPPKVRSRVKDEIGEFIVEQTLLSLQDVKTPVSGAPYKKSLNPEYRKSKQKSGRGSSANLEFEGDLKDSLEFKRTRDGIRIGHFNSREAPKADGHNNFSGDSELPERRYLPKEGEKYKSSIQKEIDRIIADSLLEAKPIAENKLKSVETKAQFWDLLKTTYGELSRAEIKTAVMRNEAFVQTLRTLGFLKWLE